MSTLKISMKSNKQSIQGQIIKAYMPASVQCDKFILCDAIFLIENSLKIFCLFFIKPHVVWSIVVDALSWTARHTCPLRRNTALKFNMLPTAGDIEPHGRMRGLMTICVSCWSLVGRSNLDAIRTYCDTLYNTLPYHSNLHVYSLSVHYAIFPRLNIEHVVTILNFGLFWTYGQLQHYESQVISVSSVFVTVNLRSLFC